MAVSVKLTPQPTMVAASAGMLSASLLKGRSGADSEPWDPAGDANEEEQGWGYDEGEGGDDADEYDEGYSY